MTEIDSLVSVFRNKAQSVQEIALCSVTIKEKYLIINAPVEFIAGVLWQNENELKKAAINSDFTGSILIMCEGERYGPRISLSD